MSVVVISVAPGAEAGQDAALMTALDLENNPPAGGRLRIAGPWWLARTRLIPLD